MGKITLSAAWRRLWEIPKMGWRRVAGDTALRGNGRQTLKPSLRFKVATIAEARHGYLPGSYLWPGKNPSSSVLINWH
jgi:hypothetical protein